MHPRSTASAWPFIDDPRRAALIAGMLLALGSGLCDAVPTTLAKERAAVVSQSVAHQSFTGHEVERRQLTEHRKSFAKQSVAEQSRVHQKLDTQAVVGQRPERKELERQSANRQRVTHPLQTRSAGT
jgi:hypothetical protein